MSDPEEQKPVNPDLESIADAVDNLVAKKESEKESDPDPYVAKIQIYLDEKGREIIENLIVSGNPKDGPPRFSGRSQAFVRREGDPAPRQFTLTFELDADTVEAAYTLFDSRLKVAQQDLLREIKQSELQKRLVVAPGHALDQLPPRGNIRLP